MPTLLVCYSYIYIPASSVKPTMGGDWGELIIIYTLDDIGIEDHVCTIKIEIYLVTRVHSISLKTRLMDHHDHDPRKAMYLSLVGLTKKDICGKSQPQP